MTREIHALRDDAAAWYSGALNKVTAALSSSVEHARTPLEPIAGEVWMGSLNLHGVTAAGGRCDSQRGSGSNDAVAPPHFGDRDIARRH
ncbi:hypothetical protein SRABI98_00627 [Microbacterium sp. Bi98]|uniref:hypothetical protein n=1 Tax=unclassified Microbacterium TaxID=2609290 RepID=UPI0006FCC39D|nr:MULTISPECIES: hypothetical protein [unclassified Microbacterium]KRD50549.1 hypothetical protein ASE34_13445 [Microbacterium sp. Root280D1]CAH0144557.1 hypothetical protein SRABI98_00627 [Microbacterium sp. Bi98]